MKRCLSLIGVNVVGLVCVITAYVVAAGDRDTTTPSLHAVLVIACLLGFTGGLAGVLGGLRLRKIEKKTSPLFLISFSAGVATLATWTLASTIPQRVQAQYSVIWCAPGTTTHQVHRNFVSLADVKTHDDFYRLYLVNDYRPGGYNLILFYSQNHEKLLDLNKSKVKDIRMFDSRGTNINLIVEDFETGVPCNAPISVHIRAAIINDFSPYQLQFFGYSITNIMLRDRR